MLTTAEAAALLNARKAEQGDPRHYTGKHIARMCLYGRLAGEKRGRDWFVTAESVEAYAAAPRDRGGRPRKGKGEMATFGTQVKAAIGQEAKAKRDGTVEYRRSYYYRPCKLEEWQANIERLLSDAGISAAVEVRDHWDRNPNKSYFQAIIKPA